MSDSDAPEDTQDPEQDSEAKTASEANPSIPIPSCITFFRHGNSDHLLAAAVEPNDKFPVGIPIKRISEWISLQGCNEWFLHEENIAQLSREIAKLKEAKVYILAEQMDCKIELQVTPDRLKAWIRVRPAFGGMPVSEDMIRKSLEDHNIRFGINEALVQRIVQEGQCERELIAEGTAPTPGRPAKFEQLVKESEHKGVPQEREDGRVDYKDLGLYISVTPGTPLLRHIAPTEGTPGTAVDGAAIPAPPATDRAAIPSIGTALSKDDPDVIVATRPGQPYFFENSVRVDPTLEVDTVDPSTGNVIFEGNIIIKGPVESGYVVKAGQDLTVLDTVEGADLSAGKNMALLTGIYGKNKSKVIAGGNLEARFLSDCTVRCGGNIEVMDLIAHCSVECEGNIYLGKSGGKGQAFGGKLVAMRGIQARLLGSVSEATTLVELAPPREILVRLAKVEEQIDAAQKSIDLIEKKLLQLKENPPEQEDSRIADFENKAASLRETLDSLKNEHEVLREKADASRKGRIKAAEVHHGVTLRIGKTHQTVNELTHDLLFIEIPEEKPPQ
jgi:uncharacterized protein